MRYLVKVYEPGCIWEYYGKVKSGEVLNQKTFKAMDLYEANLKASRIIAGWNYDEIGGWELEEIK